MFEADDASSQSIDLEASLKVPILKTELNTKRIAEVLSRYFVPYYQDLDRPLESEKFGTEGLQSEN